MAAPNTIATLNSGLLNSSVTSAYLTVADTQLGDIFLVYTFTNSAGIVGDTPIPEFTVNVMDAYTNEFELSDGISLYALQATSTGAGLDIECPLRNGPVGAWNAGYVQFRNGVTVSNYNTIGSSSGNPATIDFTTQAANSGVLVLINDSAGINKTSANWSSTDGYDPDASGTVLAKEGVTGFFGFYAAYFPDISPAGLYTFSMSGGTYLYGMIAYELAGSSGGGYQIGWIRA